MDDSFSLLGLKGENLCRRAEEGGRETSIRHYVFDDLLDTSEKLICYQLPLNGKFSVFNYVLKKEKHSLFSKFEERELGCYLGFSGGSLFTFEDFNFKIQSLEEFTLLVEAVEITSGAAFQFELCNLCQLPEKLPTEMDILLTVYSKEVKKLPPLSHFDQVADENRELLKIAVKGNERAVEKLEREIGREETERLLKEFKKKPEELFDTCILSEGQSYTLIGIVTSVQEVEVEGKILNSIYVFSEDMEFALLTQKGEVSEGDRVLTNGKMYGMAVV
ncbi:MAG: hypothetical protein DSZ25_03070 [Thermovibrio sp.]|nr:MAG: hypothetical protein DSZ25_03070 [Thermovibrio sp.]